MQIEKDASYRLPDGRVVIPRRRKMSAWLCDVGGLKGVAIEEVVLQRAEKVEEDD